ncbi:organic solute transporter Ostalpha-domain-containing protein [Coniella lustricola]|uniref:Organic solute transporter Ostalpha-domain-containing protein n=1 Tax=Coniella lustricola TaxID=2025994 RepID=A0A2T3A6M9_9PEZI|nr:organic solute transporter Ostalpha-domain-containing protein [Coniella lustricola]
MPRTLAHTPTASLAGSSGLAFSRVNETITGACACFVVLSQLVLLCRHATHLSRPNEQLHLMRICCYLPILSIGSFLQVAFPATYPYLGAWLDCAQAIALCHFFLIMCQFVSPSDSQREIYFAALKMPPSQKSHPDLINGLHFYRRTYVLVFQYPVVQLLVAILTAITESQGVYCLVSSSTHFAHLWLNIVHNVSLTVAVVACLRLLRGLQGKLKHHRPLLKLAAFKLLILVTGVIQIVYWILRSIKPTPLTPTATLSFADVFTGIPVLITALLAVPFSVLFHFAYNVEPYYLQNVDANAPLTVREATTTTTATTTTATTTTATTITTTIHTTTTAESSYHGGPLGIRAWMGVLDPSELLSGLKLGVTMLHKANLQRDLDEAVRSSQQEGIHIGESHMSWPAGSRI